ncbi:hypothetical protein ABZZ80_03825 [Streptomyces sp. NPDC006356]
MLDAYAVVLRGGEHEPPDPAGVPDPDLQRGQPTEAEPEEVGPLDAEFDES